MAVIQEEEIPDLAYEANVPLPLSTPDSSWRLMATEWKPSIFLTAALGEMDTARWQEVTVPTIPARPPAMLRPEPSRGPLGDFVRA